MVLTRPTRLCRPCRLAGPAHAAATAGFSLREREIPRETDCLLEGTGFELLVRGRDEAGCRAFDARSPSAAAWVLGAVGLFAVPGQIALGHLSDRIGREWVWTIGNAGFILCCVALILLRSSPPPLLLYLMVIAQGSLGYGLTSVMGAIPAEIFEGRNYGSIFGTVMLAAILGGAAGPWVTGIMYDRFGTYLPAFSLSTVLSLVSAIAIWLAAPRRVRSVAGRRCSSIQT